MSGTDDDGDDEVVLWSSNLASVLLVCVMIAIDDEIVGISLFVLLSLSLALSLLPSASPSCLLFSLQE